MAAQLFRPYSRYPLSIHALKDWWDKSKVTWFLRGPKSEKICQFKKLQFSLFILGNRKCWTFHLKDGNGKLWVEVIIVTFLDVLATVDVLTARNNDVKPAETRTVHFARLKSSFCFGKINKFDRDFFFWQIFNNYWTRLSKISWFVSGEQINYYYLFIDLRDTDKSRYFWISEFNNWFIIRSPSLFFNECLREAKRSAIFHARVIAKHTTQLDDTAHKQNIICRQLFCRSRGGLSTNEKDEKFATNDNITCVPPESEIPRDISFIPFVIVKYVQRWQASWVRSIASGGTRDISRIVTQATQGEYIKRKMLV